ncbi:hypothetical protein EDD85DRAFT_958072 [Armillaria nabsnona]|nr:hypothetical protein EDD85DRAFT_958072 [Armillaria nabsnona]
MTSQLKTMDLPHPPAGGTSTPAMAAAAAEFTHSQNNVPITMFFGLNRSHLHSWGAGLFSVVLTTFMVQTSQNMKPDYNQASRFLFFQILNATVLNGSLFTIPSSPTTFNFSPSSSNMWLNSLWFVSLTLSLIAALVAVLVKQWLHQYVAIVSDSSEKWEGWKSQEQWESLIPLLQKYPTLKEIEHNYIQQHAMMTDLHLLLWLHSSTSNASVHQSILQAISGMTSSPTRYLTGGDVFTLVKSLHQQIEHIKLLALSLGTNSELDELKLYCRAWILLCHLVDESLNEQLKEMLYSIAFDGPSHSSGRI